jgi:amino acid adenylation domain-containing protein
MSDISERIANLSPEKRALFELHLMEKDASAAKEQEIPRRGASDHFPLSFAQQRLWLLEQFEPGSSVYNIPFAVHLTGLLDVTALEKSLNEIVQRHEALRTTFSTVQEEPVQIITPTLPLTLTLTDLRELPETQREAELRRLADREARRPFDLVPGPLLRAALLRLDEKEHVLLLTMHHIVSDGWSMGVLFRELSALYKAFCTGEPCQLPELPIQYADFAVWQRKWLQGETLEDQLSYWRDRLNGAPPLLELPTDRPRPSIQAYQGARHSLILPPSLNATLKAMGRQEGVTLFMMLLAGFKILLYRYTGQGDIVIGSPVANRNRVEIEELIGFFVNTLVLRTDLSGNPTFRQLLGRVSEECLGAYAHQDLPFEKLVEELQPERTLSHSPLFQVMFILQNTPRSALELSGLTLNPLEVDSGAAKFDLTLSMVEETEGLHGELEYDTDLFDAATIERMAGHFHTVLEGIVADPEQRLSELPLLTAAERHQLLEEWNDTKTDYPRDKCIHHLFEEQVERVPDATALVCEDQLMTYRELNRRANQLAHFLQAQGVGPDAMVGICVERSFKMVIGVLGILKAGGAYVPLDPVYPEKRLAFILQDSEVPISLTHNRVNKCLPESHTRILNLDTEREALSREREDNPISGAEDDHPAYIIYTSGSTGVPKGVIGLHRGAVNRFNWMWETYPFEKGEVCCQKTTLNFVDSVWEIFGPLLQGIPTVLIPDVILKDPHLLIQSLAVESVTRVVLVPSFLQVLLDSFPDLKHRLPKLKFWITSGEEISAELAQQFHKTMPQSILLNLYGSSEASADCSWYDTRKGKLSLRVPIGRPISNTMIYLLDSNLQLVPIGIPAEIHVGGAGLARGYLNQPELTRNRFIRNPFFLEGHLFKTGDLARYRSDGNLEFLGRIDHQVKIRGYRIELGEIEAVLNQSPKVRENVVIVRADIPDDRRLVAYLIADKNDLPSEDDLRCFLKERLPDYMVPAVFVFLDKLPLRPNGKIDRKALAAREWTISGQEEKYAAPQDALELQLTGVWEKVLNRKPIGIRDNFFELGGHSLLAVRLFAFIEKIIGQRLPLTTLFKAPTIEQLASILRDGGWSVPWISLVPIRPTGSRLPFYCVHGAGGNTLELYPLASHLSPDQPFLGLQDPGIDGGTFDESTIEGMASHYIQDIRSFQPEGPYILGGYCFGGTVAYEMARQLQVQGEEVAALIIIEGHWLSEKESRSMLGRTRFQRVINYLVNRICLERSNLSVRRTKEKLAYIRRRARRAMEKSWVKIQIIIDPFLAAFNLRKRYSLLYRVEVLDKFHIKAKRKYKPISYNGRVIIFKAMQKSFGISSDPYLGWGRLINGEPEVSEVPGLHENIIDEPWVKVLAEKLNDSLERLNHGR